jgi:hypothetical protein
MNRTGLSVPHSHRPPLLAAEDARARIPKRDLCATPVSRLPTRKPPSTSFRTVCLISASSRVSPSLDSTVRQAVGRNDRYSSRRAPECINKTRQFESPNSASWEKSLEAKSLEAQVEDPKKDLASARAGHAEAEVARTARLFAEGALRRARQERGARRQEGHDVAAESPSAETESADSKVKWLRR